MMRLNYIAGADHDRALDHVLELTDISRPAVPFQSVDRVRGQPELCPALGLRMTSHEILGQNRNIASPFSKGRQLEAGNVEAIEEIGAEAVLRHRGLQRHVGSGDDARVQGALFRPAETAEPAVFYHAKQLCLKLEWQLRYLVEENRSRPCYLEESPLERSGIGEGARLVAEQLALEEGLGDRRAVDGNERLLGTGALGVDSAREKLLSGAGFPNEQHRDTAAGGHLRCECDCIPDCLALTNDQGAPAVRCFVLRSG